jgi:glycosyltransferase involved in cell wall biosynthesis
MRFSVDAHAIGCHLTGNEVYIRNLLKEFAELDRDNHFVAYISKPDAPRQIPASFAQRWVSTSPYRRLAWDIPSHLHRHPADLLHVQYTGPLWGKTPLVATVHDVSYLDLPEYFTRARALQLRVTVKRTVDQAARILTPSAFSKQAIVQHYSVDPDRVAVVPNAVSTRFRPVDRDVARAKVEQRLGVKGPFVLTVGDLQPRKNHLGLLAAFEEVMRAQPKLSHRLLFVGKETWYSGKLHAAVAASKVADRVHFTGFVEDDDLVDFYGACELCVYPSFYEGFGLPILEAMACGRAVACSDTTAMPEVADSAALLFDPYQTGEIARAMADALLDPELRGRLERLGQQHAAGFSWRRSAAQTLNAYYETVGVGERLDWTVKAGAV